jgi:hypothetical protein
MVRLRKASYAQALGAALSFMMMDVLFEKNLIFRDISAAPPGISERLSHRHVSRAEGGVFVSG